MNAERWIGALLFLPVPLVLVLFVRASLGLGLSLGLGVAVMASHRSYARPWVIARAAKRCLWCGANSAVERVAVSDPLGAAAWSACPLHATPLLAFVGWAERRAALLKAGILGSLLVLLAVGVAVVAGALPSERYSDAVALFQGSVALSVLPLSLFGPGCPAPTHARSPLPLHIQALVGSLTVVWLFRVVGVVWLVQAVRHVLGS
ncbi:MAG: hypothetical protein NDJ94_01250 [Vicinamibacteria bacterium]|nr:hypothetical protein [Vicinamibacteria bacterium]